MTIKKLGVIMGFCLMFLIISGIFTYSKFPIIESQNNNTYTTGLRNLVIQTEDRRFYSHIGVDLYGMVRAGYYNIIYGQIVQGGSTIPQQLLKHHRGYTNRTRSHKIQEIRGSIILTMLYSKTGPTGKQQGIHESGNPGKGATLNYYLDHVPFPNGGVVGYDSACDYYFDKQCDQLFESQILFLIAVAQDGSNPYHQTNFDHIKKLSIQLCYKSDFDCSQMEQLSPTQVHDLSRHDDSLDPRTRLALEDYPSVIFDSYLTNQVDSLIQTNRVLLKQHQVHDCCIVVIGPDGKLISYNQCRSYDERVGTVDLCRTRRQTGSAIKPFIYAQAFEEFGYTGGTMIMDEPVSFDLGNGSLYEPKNFDNQFHGSVTLAQALGNSFNIPAIKLTRQLGVIKVINNINQLRSDYGQNLTGLESDKTIFTPEQLGLSVGLGTYEMSPLEFSRLWGYRYSSSLITNEIKAILSDSLNRVVSFGQDNLLNRSGWFVKTGTSRKFVDGWTCGGKLDHELIVCVRVGNHDVSSMDSSSVDTAGYIWYLTTQLVDRSDLTK